MSSFKKTNLLFQIGRSLASILSLSLILIACSKSATSPTSTDTSVSASKPSGVIGKIDSGVQGAGTQIGSTALGSNAVAKLMKLKANPMAFLMNTAFASGGGIDSVCDSHATPIGLINTDGDFPAMNFFCMIAKNTGSPDSVQGSYLLIKGISCMLENAGITWDGAAHSVVGTVDSACFTASQISNIGGASMTITVTASAPAAFNSYFDRGIEMVVPSFGTFKMAARVSGTAFEFIAMEDQSAYAANKTGVYAASFDSSTGNLRFEARHNRYACPSSDGSCGWSRHARIFANLNVDASGNPTGINLISGAYSQIYDNSVSGGSGYSGSFDTIHGDISTGVKARHWGSSPVASASLGLGSQYSEVANTKCYTSTSSSGSGCGAGIGITAGSLPFTLHPSTTYSSSNTWLTSYAGMSFTTVGIAD